MNELIMEILNTDNLRRFGVIILAMWVLMLIAVMLDLWTGVEAAKARGEYVHSGGFRRTFIKVGEYWRVLVMLLLIDLIGNFFVWYGLPYASILGTIAVIAIELRSLVENMRDKHSSAADVPDVIRKIIKCKDAQKAVEILKELHTNNNTI